MSMSNVIVLNQHKVYDEKSMALLEKVMIKNDFSGLSGNEKVQHINNVCLTLGLNPMTRPIQLISFRNKEVPYFTKDATEQLRKINNVSINKIETKMLDGGLYVVTVYASTPDGRQDSSTGVIVVGGMKGDDLANTMMKAETKAKRRVTLSICGLGFIDESEADSIPHAKKVDLYEEKQEDTIFENGYEKDSIQIDFVNYLHEIKNASTLSELQSIFNQVKKSSVKNITDLFNKIIEAKDQRKKELSVIESKSEDVKENNINEETGEIIL
jgi:hypothetical protein